MRITKRYNAALSSTVAAAALLSAMPALAQDDTGNRVDENVIMVTAQFREQNLQDTPLAISAITGDMMDARSQVSISDIATRQPSVAIEASASGSGPSASNITIRGIGQTDTIPSVEPGVGVYIDDVYYGVLTGSVFELVDLDRVEILRGPQGTLSGKNSEGGSIRLYSREPDNDLGGFAELTYGALNRMQARGAFNVPLIEDRLMLRVSGVFRSVDGYVDRLDYRCVNPGATDVSLVSGASINNDCVLGDAGGQDLAAVRASLRMVLSDSIENTIIVDRISDHRGPDPFKLTSQHPLWAGGNNFLTAPHSYTNYATYLGYPGTEDEYQAFVGNNSDQWGISNRLVAELNDSLTFTSITGYRETTARGTQDGDTTPFNVFMQDVQFRHEQFTQELRLSGVVDELLDWTIGGFYYEGDSLFPGRIDIPGGLALGGGGLNLDFLTNDPISTQSTSGFAHASLHLTDSLNLTGGLRYTDEKKEYTFVRLGSDGGPAPFAVAGLNGTTSTYSGNRWDWRLAVDYRWSDALMTYAQVATGFKGGGVNPRPYFPSQALAFQPEEVMSYEVGFKSDLLDRRVRINVAGFFTDFSNMQLILGSCDSVSPFPGAPCSQTTNAGDSELWGVEVEAFVEPVDGFQIDGSASFTDFQYTSINPSTGIPLGSQLPFLVKRKIVLGAQYEFDAFGGSLTPRVDFDYRSGFETEALSLNPAVSRTESRSLVNARISYTPEGGDWELSAAVTNLFDHFYFANMFDRSAPPFFVSQGYLGRPREWSVSIRRDF